MSLCTYVHTHTCVCECLCVCWSHVAVCMCEWHRAWGGQLLFVFAVVKCLCKYSFKLVHSWAKVVSHDGYHGVVTVCCVLFSQKHRKRRNRVSPVEVGAVTVTERVSPTTFLGIIVLLCTCACFPLRKYGNDVRMYVYVYTLFLLSRNTDIVRRETVFPQWRGKGWSLVGVLLGKFSTMSGLSLPWWIWAVGEHSWSTFRLCRWVQLDSEVIPDQLGNRVVWSVGRNQCSGFLCTQIYLFN